MMTWIYAVVSVLLVSLISFVGIISLVLRKEKLERILFFLVAFAVGALFGDAFIHLLPESFLRNASNTVATSLYVIVGIMIFFVLEKFLHWRHCHVPSSQKHTHPMVTVNLIGDGVHNLIDGILIGTSYLVSIPIGMTTTLAVVLHEIPQEIGDFGILVHGGLSIRKALTYNFFSGLIAVVGAVMALLAGPALQESAFIFLPITAGGFIYIAGSDLIPELKHDVRIFASLWQFFFILLGVGIMAALAVIE